MEELVRINKDSIMTTSLIIAEKFGKNHRDVLRIIDSKKELFTKRNFTLSEYKDSTGRKLPMYYLDKDFTTFIIMGFTGSKADNWKIKYIEAFNKMESIIKNRNNKEWIENRGKGKLCRKEETDTIQKLVEYAKEQGSENADKLYVVYSKLANKMAKISDRDSATTQQLSELSFIENIILHCIDIGMEKGETYKEIYQYSKKQIESFKAIAFLE